MTNMLNLYAIKDVKADTFIALHPMQSDILAQRGLTEALGNQQSDLSRYPEDFQLYQVGEWDSNSAELKSLRTPRFVCSVFELAQAVRERALKQAQDKAAFDKRFAEAAGEVK